MAVPFSEPEVSVGNRSNGGASNQQTPSTSNQSSPQQSPTDPPRINGEHLIHLLYDTLYRIGELNYANTPLSPTCSPNTPNNSTNSVYGDIFFPRTNLTPRTPRTSMCRNHFDYPRRNRLSSTGEELENDMTCYEQSNEMESSSSSSDDVEEHLNHMAARENLQEFPGRVPPRRKKKGQQTFAWPTVVTAVVLAVGCGILVTRN